MVLLYVIYPIYVNPSYFFHIHCQPRVQMDYYSISGLCSGLSLICAARFNKSSRVALHCDFEWTTTSSGRKIPNIPRTAEAQREGKFLTFHAQREHSGSQKPNDQ